ncbi:MAG: DUF2628 domain-containing protein [Holosporales bacterium]|jgi:hypothetical protein|nr:DUF2628 domain-containing protein [Holosporales bacterium]
MQKENKQENECIDHPISEMDGMVKIAGRPYGNSSLLKKIFKFDEDYYAKQFQRIKEKGGFALSWNWAAVLGTGVWMVHHKMYIAYFALFVLEFILLLPLAMFLIYVIPNAGRHAAILSTVHLIVMGCMGNVLLYYAAKRKYKVGYAFSTRIRNTNRARLYLTPVLGFITSITGIFMNVSQVGYDNILQNKARIENQERTCTEVTRETQYDTNKQGTRTLKSQQQPGKTMSVTAFILMVSGALAILIFKLILLGVAIKDYTRARQTKKIYTQRFIPSHNKN